MSLPPHPGLFSTVERHCADSDPAPRLRFFDGSDPVGVPLSLEQARRTVYDRSVCDSGRAALWHQIAERAREAAEGSDWPTAVVWLGLPGLRRTARKLSHGFRVERGEVEAELVTCYLEALAEIGPDTPDPGGQVLRSACSGAWALWRRALPERAVDDVEVTGGARFDQAGDEFWEMDYAPPAHRAGLSANVRITVPAHRVEGVRLGALARAWGVADTTAAVRHSGRGRQVATMSLRRGGRKG
ncbi:hypothetical protein [Streptomyces parvus]|uniref:hypothetical protein n=1 Tax=Streptomyces parvus TaxID=66428 RepID=UPI0035E307F3